MKREGAAETGVSPLDLIDRVMQDDRVTAVCHAASAARLNLLFCMGNFTHHLILLLFGFGSALVAAPVPLKLEGFDGPVPAFQETSGIVEIHGPMSVRATPAPAPAPGALVLEMEYFCVGGVPSFTALAGPPFDAKNARTLPPLGHSETWNTYIARIAPQGAPFPPGWQQLRFDFSMPAESVLQLRNICLRPEQPGEFDPPKSLAGVSKEALETYLDRTFSARITRVALGTDQVRIEGNAGVESAGLFLADIPMDVMLDEARSWQTLVPVKPANDGNFVIDLPRHRSRDGRDYDRLTSRWQLVRKNGARCEPISNARYPGQIACRALQLAPANPANKKGLGGWHYGVIPDELEQLGISAVTVNVLVHTLIALEPGPDTVPFQWQGRTYHANEKALARMDETLIEAAKHRLMVSAILLVGNPAKDPNPIVKLMGHPDATRDGIYAMPNVTSQEGISLYGAVLNLMAERWSRPDEKYGRVHYWIMHNEVDAGWVWTNAGAKPDIVYMDLYQRSMRLMDLIAREYDPNSRPFISLTHFWADRGEDPHWYGSKRLLDLLVRYTAAEGPFPWALAYHPYPQNLFNPRTWEDKEATFSFDTHQITPKNLEVLDAYMKQPALLHLGKFRPVHLSENGFNSKDYSPAQLEYQAAGMALAWKKMANLTSIQSWQYHNWIDNRDEGGLRIGLRKFRDEPGDPLGKKPIWFLYQAFGTPHEDTLAAPYLKTIGIRSWEDVIHKGTVR